MCEQLFIFIKNEQYLSVTSKNNDDKQYIWESDASSFSVVEDPRGNTLKRGTQISLHLKEEAHDFLEPATLKDLVKKYSQFINFNIYMWSSKVLLILYYIFYIQYFLCYVVDDGPYTRVPVI